MKIGYIFNQSTIIGGGEISFIDLILSVGSKGISPIVFIPGSGEIEQRLAQTGIQTVRCSFPHIGPWSLFTFIARVVLLSRRFRSLGLDLIHVNGARSMLYAGPAAKIAAIPCVWHNRVLHRDRVLDRIRGRFATAIIANSRAVAETLQRYVSRTISVVYNGFDLSLLRQKNPTDVKQAFQIQTGPIILCVGRLCPWKGFHDLLEACSLINKKGIGYSCLIIGKAMPHEQNYEDHLVHLKGKFHLSNVYFAGWRNDVPGIMKAADVLVVPSDAEPFGRTIVEAWACGLPVIATNAGGPAEIVRHGENGLLVPPGNPERLADAIGSLLGDRDLCAQLAIAGQKSAESFSIEKHRDNVMALYQTLTARRQP